MGPYLRIYTYISEIFVFTNVATSQFTRQEGKCVGDGLVFFCNSESGLSMLEFIFSRGGVRVPSISKSTTLLIRNPIILLLLF